MTLQNYLVADMEADIRDSYDTFNCPKCGSGGLHSTPHHDWKGVFTKCFDCGFCWETSNPDNIEKWIASLGNGAYA